MTGSPIPIRRAVALAAVLLLTILISPVWIASAAAHDNDIWWNDLLHDSRDPLYRSPGGAVPTGTAVRLRLRAADGDLTAAKVRVWNDRIDQQNIYNMTRVASGVALPGDPGPYEFWEVTLPASALPTVYWYRFIVEDGSKVDYYEDDIGRTGGWGEVYEDSPDISYQLTIYDPAFETPDWVKNAVIYQIFTDRFRDGDSSNNPAAGEFFYGAFDTIVRSNTTDWNARICDPRDNPNNSVECLDKYSNNFYGGDLQGIIDVLDYLDNLGVTAIYLNPIFESPSNHKYDTKDFMQIDDNFGDLALFQQLVSEAGSRGMKIILDGVFNHSSSDSRYFDRYSRWDANGDATTIGTDDDSGACEATISPYSSWYYFDVAAGPAPCSDNRDYESWFGYDSLPKIDASNPAVRDYFIGAGGGATSAVGPYWISQGAAGWRLDVGGDVDPGQINNSSNTYWELFREAVKSVDADAYIVGEEWGNATSWTVGDEWDATMNYQFAAAVLSFWRDEPFTDNDFNSGSSAGVLNPLDADKVAERLLNLEERYPPEAFAAMMNLFNSHDTNRVLFLLNHDADQNDVALYDNPAYDWSDSITRYKGALIMQMTLPGAPTIYYGDEVGTISPPGRDGSQWQDDPYNRAPFPWPDETGTPFYEHLQNPAVLDSLYNYVTDLTGIRNSHSALRTGSFDVLDSGGSNVFAYGRKSAAGDEIVIVLANKSDSVEEATVDLNGYAPSGADLEDLLSDDVYTLNDSDQLIIPVPARGGRIMLVQGTYATPDAVDDLTATASGAAQIDLDWSAATGAASYDVYRSQLSGGGYQFIGNTTNTDYADTGLTTGVNYYYVVVSRAADELASGWSNEATDTLAYDLTTNAYINLQWPHTINNHVIGVNNYTPDVYGQLWIQDAVYCGGPHPLDGIVAQVGYGPQSDLPTETSWEWFDMAFDGECRGDFGSNHEYKGQMLPTEIGTFYYTTRWSGDGGQTWVYTDKNGYPYSADQAGVLTVTQSNDTTAPAAPQNLAVTGVTSASITLGWDAHPNANSDLYAFRVYRGPVGGPHTQIAQIVNTAAVSYVDTNVTAGATYEYYVTAIDTSVNESDPSNTVEATAENLLVDVTFKVTVPSFTPGTDTVYLAGGFGGAGYPQWTPDAPTMAMTETSPGVWEITLQILDGTNLVYKYARGSWEKVEKQADGFAEVIDRPLSVDYGSDGTQLVEDTVLNWRDRIVVDHYPADGATGVAPDTVISASWNKWMPTPPPGTFSVTGPGGAVSGVFTWDGGTNTHTFWPLAYLVPGQYTVNISGNNDGGDNQFVPVTFTFEVPAPPPAPAIFVSAKTAGTTGDGVTFGNEDILKWDGAAWSLWFDGSAAGLSAAQSMNNVNAMWIADTDANNPDVVLSFGQNSRKVPGIVPKVDGTDLVRWNGSAFSLYFDGSDVGLKNMVAEKIDGLHILPGSESPIGSGCQAYLLISTQGAGAVPKFGGGTLRFRGEDVLGFCATSLGASTAGGWHMVLDGSTQGLPINAIDSISVSEDGSTMFLTTNKVINIPADGVAGGHSMIYAYDFDTATFSGPHFVAANAGLPRQVDALHVVGPLP